MWHGREPEGITYEAEQGHAEILVRDLGLQQVHAVFTPRVKESKFDNEGSDEDDRVSSEESSRDRGFVARANFLAQDRSELMFLVKEASRSMANPTLKEWDKVKRIGRFLKGAPREQQLLKWQEKTQDCNVFGL